MNLLARACVLVALTSALSACFTLPKIPAYDSPDGEYFAQLLVKAKAKDWSSFDLNAWFDQGFAEKHLSDLFDTSRLEVQNPEDFHGLFTPKNVAGFRGMKRLFVKEATAGDGLLTTFHELTHGALVIDVGDGFYNEFMAILGSVLLAEAVAHSHPDLAMHMLGRALYLGIPKSEYFNRDNPHAWGALALMVLSQRYDLRAMYDRFRQGRGEALRHELKAMLKERGSQQLLKPGVGKIESTLFGFQGYLESLITWSWGESSLEETLALLSEQDFPDWLDDNIAYQVLHLKAEDLTLDRLQGFFKRYPDSPFCDVLQQRLCQAYIDLGDKQASEVILNALLELSPAWHPRRLEAVALKMHWLEEFYEGSDQAYTDLVLNLAEHLPDPAYDSHRLELYHHGCLTLSQWAFEEGNINKALAWSSQALKIGDDPQRPVLEFWQWAMN